MWPNHSYNNKISHWNSVNFKGVSAFRGWTKLIPTINVLDRAVIQELDGNYTTIVLCATNLSSLWFFILYVGYSYRYLIGALLKYVTKASATRFISLNYKIAINLHFILKCKFPLYHSTYYYKDSDSFI